ncbi:MAG: hypothetical protein RLZZ298_660 [Pseudomonadota bacterium]|jgi:hypothetical protein
MNLFSLANLPLPPLPATAALGDHQLASQTSEPIAEVVGLDETLQATLACDSWAGAASNLAGGVISPPGSSLRDMAAAIAGRLMVRP